MTGSISPGGLFIIVHTTYLRYGYHSVSSTATSGTKGWAVHKPQLLRHLLGIRAVQAVLYLVSSHGDAQNLLSAIGIKISV